MRKCFVGSKNIVLKKRKKGRLMKAYDGGGVSKGKGERKSRSC